MTTAAILRARIEDKPGLVDATALTRTGRYFDFADPRFDQIDHRDIAWGLANTCRFNGQCLEFYSVAQHSRLVASIVPRQHRFAALMHDAAEAYTGDMIGPLKQLCPEFKSIEKRIERVIFDKYEIPYPMHPCIKHADLRLLRTEQRDLTSAPGDSWNGLDQFAPLPETIVPEPPDVAAERWLQAFRAIRRDHLRKEP